MWRLRIGAPLAWARQEGQVEEARNGPLRREGEVGTAVESEAACVTPIIGGFGTEFGEEGPEVRSLTEWANGAYSFLEVGVYEVSRKCVFGMKSSVHEESTIRLDHMIHEVLTLHEGTSCCVVRHIILLY